MGTPSFLIKNTTSSAALHSEESGAFRRWVSTSGVRQFSEIGSPRGDLPGHQGVYRSFSQKPTSCPLGRALFRGGPNHSSLVLRKDDGCIRTDAEVATNRHSVHPNATCINIKRRPVSKIRVVDCGIGIHPNAPSTATRES
jgi:hypothetical protein